MIKNPNIFTCSGKKRNSWRVFLALSSVFAPVLLAIFCTVLLGSGLGAAFAMFGGFFSGLTGGKGPATQEEIRQIHAMTLDEVLDLVTSGQIDESYYDMMFINQKELVYLLEQVKDYNKQQVVRDIEIECKHEYTIWVEDETDSNGGRYETIVEYPYRTVQVGTQDIEKFQLDWQLVYALCLTDAMGGIEGWKKTLESEDAKAGSLEHYGQMQERIDSIIEAVKMQYDYITDLARDPKSRYSLEECEALVHTTYAYGDSGTEEGAWLYYLPHSVLRSASSSYSCMYYILSPDGGSLEKLVASSEMRRFEQVTAPFCKKYNFGYFASLLNFIPGGPDLAKRMTVYYSHMEDGILIEEQFLENYEIGSGIHKEDLPTGREYVWENYEDLPDFGNLAFDETIGGSIVREAATKIGCAYDQNHRWEEGVYDCSSLVWRVLKTIGIDLSSICAGSTAAEECRGMVNAGMLIPLEEMQQGDIIFYSSYANNRYRNITHVAIYAGDGKIIHARGTAYGVQMGAFYQTGLVCVCRPYKGGG